MVLKLRPCPDKDGKPSWYRLRLLAWSSPEKNDRDDPFIERFVHQVWKKTDKGYNVVDDEVTCPVTKHVHVEGNRYDACPMCRLSNQHFMTWKESGWKDRDAAKKNKEIGRKYEAIVPVYVVDDPNYQLNNTTFKVLIFNDKKLYMEFRQKIEKASLVNCVFNGRNAVDCCIHVSEVEETRNAGQPNEYVYKHKLIDKVTFTTKPYDIEKITKDWVTGSGFDEQYYTSSSPEELQLFYNRHYKISNDDIPEEDMVQLYDAPSKDSTIAGKPPVTASDDASTEEVDALIGDLAADPDDVLDSPAPTSAPAAASNDSTDDDVDALIADLDF